MKTTSYSEITDIVLNAMSARTGIWNVAFLISLGFLGMGGFAVYYQINHGLEWSGLNHPINWGGYITNFIFWIGIGHAGTLISSILYLLRAKFRTPIHRIAEAMTVFAVLTAALFPIIHLGRALYAFWFIPYSNQRELWVNFKSPLLWDAFAIGTYLLVSTAFLIVGLVPDLATIRDRSSGLKKQFYRVFAFGYKGAHYQWHYYLKAYLMFAALCTPLVISVHSIVSWDFATSSLPGWHSTLFAPYFVAGAILSGCAMTLTIVIPLRTLIPDLKQVIKPDSLEGVAKISILMSLVISFSYLIEFFGALYSTHGWELNLFRYYASGDISLWFWLMLLFVCICPLLFTFRSIRKSPVTLLVISILINIGMWAERFIIVTGPLAYGLDPMDRSSYQFEWVEIWITLGGFGWFFTWFLLFMRLFPIIAIAETKAELKTTKETKS